MFVAIKSTNEEARLNALRRLEILDTPQDPAFDKLTSFAARFFKVPIALITFVDEDRQWFKSRYGLELNQTPHDVAFCSHAILEDETFVVPNATEDPRFCDNPLVLGDPNIRFYAGHPIISHEGYKLGTLCVIDNKPRQFSVEEQNKLSELANKVSVLLESRLKTLRHKKLNKRLQYEIQRNNSQGLLGSN